MSTRTSSSSTTTSQLSQMQQHQQLSGTSDSQSSRYQAQPITNLHQATCNRYANDTPTYMIDNNNDINCDPTNCIRLVPSILTNVGSQNLQQTNDHLLQRQGASHLPSLTNQQANNQFESSSSGWSIGYECTKDSPNCPLVSQGRWPSPNGSFPNQVASDPQEAQSRQTESQSYLDPSNNITRFQQDSHSRDQHKLLLQQLPCSNSADDNHFQPQEIYTTTGSGNIQGQTIGAIRQGTASSLVIPSSPKPTRGDCATEHGPLDYPASELRDFRQGLIYQASQNFSSFYSQQPGAAPGPPCQQGSPHEQSDPNGLNCQQLDTMYADEACKSATTNSQPMIECYPSVQIESQISVSEPGSILINHLVQGATGHWTGRTQPPELSNQRLVHSLDHPEAGFESVFSTINGQAFASNEDLGAKNT